MYEYSRTEIPIRSVRFFHRKLFFAANQRKSVEIDPPSAMLPGPLSSRYRLPEWCSNFVVCRCSGHRWQIPGRPSFKALFIRKQQV